jgi:hypothetical protein
MPAGLAVAYAALDRISSRTVAATRDATSLTI